MICEFPNIPHRLPDSWKEAGLRLAAGLASSLGWAGIESQVRPSCFSAQPKHQEAFTGSTGVLSPRCFPQHSWRLAPSLPKKLARSHFGLPVFWAYVGRALCVPLPRASDVSSYTADILTGCFHESTAGREEPTGVLYVVTGTDNRTLLRAWMQIENTLLGFLTLQLQTVGMHQLPDTTH